MNLRRENTTFCTGFWHIDKNSKYSLNHYLNLVPKTLSLLGDSNIVFFYDNEDILECVKKSLKTDKFKQIKIDVTSLPTYELSQNYLQSCKNQDNRYLERIVKGRENYEKGLVHYNREYKESGEDSFRKVFTIWTSKLFLVESMIQENPFDTEYFAWVDISVARFNKQRENWNFMEQVYSKEHIHHYRNIMRYFGHKLNLNASFILGHKYRLLELTALFRSQLEKSKNSNYAHDEETILHLLYEENSELFRSIDTGDLKLKAGRKGSGKSILSRICNLLRVRIVKILSMFPSRKNRM